MRFLTVLLRLERWAAAMAYTAVAGLLLGEIVARELFATTIWGSQKIAVFAAIYAGFLGLSLATAANSHLRPQFADRLVPHGWRRVVARLGDVLSALLFIGLGLAAAAYVKETHAFGDRVAILYTPLWWIQIIMPYAFFSSALRHVVFAVRPALKPDGSMIAESDGPTPTIDDGGRTT